LFGGDGATAVLVMGLMQYWLVTVQVLGGAGERWRGCRTSMCKKADGSGEAATQSAFSSSSSSSSSSNNISSSGSSSGRGSSNGRGSGGSSGSSSKTSGRQA